MKTFAQIKRAIILLSLWSAVGAAQEDISLERVGVEHGLGQGSVQCILQDSRGFLWFGTGGGLNRFDGRSFKALEQDAADPNPIWHDEVTALCEDLEGDLWIGTWGGLHRLDIETGAVRSYRHDEGDERSLAHDSVTCLLCDSAGVIWIGTRNGLSMRTPRSEHFVNSRQGDGPEGLAGRVVFAICEDRGGDVWIGTGGRALHRYVRGGGGFERFVLPESLAREWRGEREPYSMALYETVGQELLVGFGVQGLFEFDRQGERFAPFSEELNELIGGSYYMIRAIAQDARGDVWIGLHNGGGLVRLGREDGRMRRYRAYAMNEGGLGSNYLFCLHLDASGVLWAGTRGGGATKVICTILSRLEHSLQEPFSLSSSNVRSICEDSEGALWVGYVNGLERVDWETRSTQHYLEIDGDGGPLRLVSLFHISEADRQHLFIGGRQFGLILFDKRTGRYRRVLEGVFARDLLAGRDGDYWVAAANDGIIKLDGRSLEPVRWRAAAEEESINLENRFVRTLVQSPDGLIWAGTNEGLYRFDPRTGEEWLYGDDPSDPYGLRNPRIRDLLWSREGVLWMATEGGLERFDPRTGRFSHFSQADGLPSSHLVSLLEDANKRLWIATMNGLCRLDPRTGSFTNYREVDGLQSTEFRVSSAHRGPSGKLYFGGINGINIIEERQAEPPRFDPPIVVIALRSVEESMEPPAGIRTAEPIEIHSWSEEISVEYAALDFRAPGSIRYEYQIEGWDEEWKSTGTTNTAHLPHLPEGQYVFRVRCLSREGSRGEREASVALRVLPPFWQTLWFQVGVVAFAAALLGTAFLFRIRSVQRQRDSLQSEVARRTRQLARSNRELEAFNYAVSHDLRSPLARVDAFTRILSEEYSHELGEKGAVYLDKISRAVRSMEGVIEGLLRLAQVSSAQLQREGVDLSLLARSVASSLEYEDLYRSVLFEIQGGMEANGDPSLLKILMENLLGNAWKYTIREERAKIEFFREQIEGLPVYIVRDNGVGFDMQHADRLFEPFQRLHTKAEFEGSGIGLATVKRIVERHGGRIWVQSEPGEGSSFYFTIQSV